MLQVYHDNQIADCIDAKILTFIIVEQVLLLFKHHVHVEIAVDGGNTYCDEYLWHTVIASKEKLEHSQLSSYVWLQITSICSCRNPDRIFSVIT